METYNPYEYNVLQENSQEPGVITEARVQDIPGMNVTTKFKPKYSSKDIELAEKKSKKTIARFFSNLSRLGMNYDEQVIKNMRAIPADKNLLPENRQVAYQNLFQQLQSAWKQKANADQSFYEKDISSKRENLRMLAMQPELEDILDTFSNEAIVYDSNFVYFAEPFIDDKDLVEYNKDVRSKINDCVSAGFKRFYKMLRWRTRAWDDFKRFLVEGCLAWEIVYDSLEKPTKIIGLVPLDPATLTKKFENDKWYWVQYKDVKAKERKLLDSQVIYIVFQETESISRTSYLERLIRPFNIYRIIEQAQIIFCVTNAQYKMKFTIPVKGMNRALGSQTLNSAMQRYREDIKFISESGELTINGQPQMPFNKEYWMAESESGTPDIETLAGDSGPDLLDSDYLKFFRNQLYKVSKIPLNRFDVDSGEGWFGTDAESYARNEIDFGRYVTRMRNIFSQIILKPIWIQLCLDMPEMMDSQEFQDCIQLHYHSYNLFEEMMEIQLMDRRIESINNMKELQDMDMEGNEVTFFASKFLVQKYLHLSDADLKLNEKYKQEEVEKFNLAGGERPQQPGQSGRYGGGAPGGWESMLAKMSDMERRIDEKLKKYKDIISESEES